MNLFGEIKVKLGNNIFESEVFLFYLCIDDMYFFNLLFQNIEINNVEVEVGHISIYEKFQKIKKNLKLRLHYNNV
uniref:hypothetical protein n=1 Tax=Borreliella californiensis TaxID=373543 RepID=UPI003B210E40